MLITNAALVNSQRLRSNFLCWWLTFLSGLVVPLSGNVPVSRIAHLLCDGPWKPKRRKLKGMARLPLGPWSAEAASTLIFHSIVCSPRLLPYSYSHCDSFIHTQCQLWAPTWPSVRHQSSKWVLPLSAEPPLQLLCQARDESGRLGILLSSETGSTHGCQHNTKTHSARRPLWGLAVMRNKAN